MRKTKALKTVFEKRYFLKWQLKNGFSKNGTKKRHFKNRCL